MSHFHCNQIWYTCCSQKDSYWQAWNLTCSFLQMTSKDVVFLLVCGCGFRYGICFYSGQLCFQRPPLSRTTFGRFFQGALSFHQTLYCWDPFQYLFSLLCVWPACHADRSPFNTRLAYILSVTQRPHFNQDHFREWSRYLLLEKQPFQHWICLKDD